MNRIDIIRFLSGELSPNDMSDMYKRELARHLKMLEKRGASADVILSGNQPVYVDRAGFNRLQSYVEMNKVSRDLLDYIFDALSMADNVIFSEQEIRDSVLDFSDHSDES